MHVYKHLISNKPRKCGGDTGAPQHLQKICHVYKTKGKVHSPPPCFTDNQTKPLSRCVGSSIKPRRWCTCASVRYFAEKFTELGTGYIWAYVSVSLDHDTVPWAQPNSIWYEDTKTSRVMYGDQPGHLMLTSCNILNSYNGNFQRLQGLICFSLASFQIHNTKRLLEYY